MSGIDYLEDDDSMIKNDIFMSDFYLYGNEFIYMKEEEKNDEKSYSDESNLQNFIKQELIKDMSIRNSEEEDIDDINRYKIPKPENDSTNMLLKSPINLFSTSVFPKKNEENNKNKIFNIIKVPKHKQIFQCLQRKRELNDKNKKYILDWDNMKVPKEKHFHFDRKKHRIVFQRKHLKVIYSIVDLNYPIDFDKCFNMIKNHIGDKTVQNYGKGKSFHIIKINNEEKIVTLKDKKSFLRGNKNNK